MLKPRLILGAVIVGVFALSPVTPGAAAVTTDLARWGMNEPRGATSLNDSSGNGVRGTVGAAIVTGSVFDGATGYLWPKTDPTAAPAKPERLVVVADDRLNPGAGDFAVTIRFRTSQSASNLLQKGQSQNRGGFFKWENVRGQQTCVFRGYDAAGNRLSKAVNSGVTPLNDGAWHVVTCARTADRVTMTIDGTRVRRALGPTGTISNNVPLTIGGKQNCDQVTTTCDYFSGGMDYVRITH